MKILMIILKEWLDLLKNRSALAVVIITPLLLSVTPIASLFAMQGQQVNVTPEVITFVNNYIETTDPKLIGQFMVVSQNLILLMLVPIIIPLTIGIHSILSEKQTGSLEVLLTEPIETWEILIGKILAAAAPGVVCSWLSYGLLIIGASIVTSHPIVSYVTSTIWIFVTAIIAPLLTIFSITSAVIISSRINDIRVAQLLSGLVTLPIVSISLLQVFNELQITWFVIITSAVVIMSIDIIMFLIAIVVFDRESILTR